MELAGFRNAGRVPAGAEKDWAAPVTQKMSSVSRFRPAPGST
jgi:hypothetical protein